jgi:hypothetical protein
MSVNRIFGAVACALILCASPHLLTAAEPERSAGQLLYVPTYSEIAISEGRHNFRLTVTLSIRNLDPKEGLKIWSIDYYDSSGKIVRGYISDPIIVRPLSAFEIIVADSDLAGGISASFLVEWSAESAIISPLVETIMIGGASTQGVSFVGRARVIKERSE